MGGVLGDDLLVSVDVVAVLQVLVLAPAALRVAVTAELLRHALARPRAQEEGGGGAGRAAGARGGAGLLAPASILFLRAAAVHGEYEIRFVRAGLMELLIFIFVNFILLEVLGVNAVLRRSIASLSFVHHRNLIVITRFRFIQSCSIGANWVMIIIPPAAFPLM